MQQLHAAGCALVALHGRTRDQKHSLSTWTVADWDAIAAVAAAVDIPVVLDALCLHWADRTDLEYRAQSGAPRIASVLHLGPVYYTFLDRRAK